MNPLSLTVLLVTALMIYAGLGLLFHSPDQGFGWLGQFLLGTAVVVALFVLYVRADSRKRVANAKDSDNDEEAS